MSRIDKENYYLDIAETVMERSTCRRRRYGALIVHNDEIIATGYNGAPRGRANCIDLGRCVAEARGDAACRGVHAEANAILSASRSACLGGAIYLVGRDAVTGELLEDPMPCPTCRGLIINAGLSKVVLRDTGGRYQVLNVQDWVFDDDTILP